MRRKKKIFSAGRIGLGRDRWTGPSGRAGPMLAGPTELPLDRAGLPLDTGCTAGRGLGRRTRAGWAARVTGDTRIRSRDGGPGRGVWSRDSIRGPNRGRQMIFRSLSWGYRELRVGPCRCRELRASGIGELWVYEVERSEVEL
ncbi:hypothetical protein CRG98_045641 [Punica granatum]|uniref:Uncharacterized protein n=1 Tax=Punica granatum TaxID=22663 RepID=A0A2I0HQI3_PUNGR|nr:hypothetical protein CRG98_045641 [Punica granatum]